MHMKVAEKCLNIHAGRDISLTLFLTTYLAIARIILLKSVLCDLMIKPERLLKQRLPVN